MPDQAAFRFPKVVSEPLFRMGVELGLSNTQARRTLRRIELEAYASVVTAFRAQGPLTAEKKSVLEDLSKLLVISQERHRAEVRRAVNDERLASVAASVYASDTEKAWRIEGQKLVASSSPKLVAHHVGHLSQAITATLATSTLGAGLQRHPTDDVTTGAPARLQNALRFVLGQNPAVAKTLPDVKRHSNKSPSYSGTVNSEVRTIKSIGTAATLHSAQNSSGSSAMQKAVACKDEPVATATIALSHHGAATHLVQGTLHSQPGRLEAQPATSESPPFSIPALTPASRQPPVIAWEKPSTPLYVAPPGAEDPDDQRDPGDHQNLEDCRDPGCQQDPGDHQDAGDQQNHQDPGTKQIAEDQQSPGDQQNSGDQQDRGDHQDPKGQHNPGDQQILESFQDPGDQQDPKGQQNPVDQQDPKGQQNPVDQQILESFQDPGDQQDPKGQHSPGDQQILKSFQDPDDQQDPKGQQNPVDQQILESFQDPDDQQDPKGQQNAGDQQESFQDPGDQQGSETNQDPEEGPVGERDSEGHEGLQDQQEGLGDHTDPQGWQDSGAHASAQNQPVTMELQCMEEQQEDQQAHWNKLQGDAAPSPMPAPPSLNTIVDPQLEQRNLLLHVCEAQHGRRPAELALPLLLPLTSRKRPYPESPPHPSPKRPVPSPTLPPPPPPLPLSISDVNIPVPLVPCFTPTLSTPLSPPPLQAIDPYGSGHPSRALYVSPPDEYCDASDSKPVLLMYPAHHIPASSTDCLSQGAIEQVTGVMPSLSSDVADGVVPSPDEVMPVVDAALSGIADEIVPVSDTGLSLEESKAFSELALGLGLDPALLNMSSFFQLVQSSMDPGGLLQVTTDEGDLRTMMEQDANSGFSVTSGDLGMGTESNPLLLKEEHPLDVGVAPEVSLEAGDPLEGIPPELAKTIQAMAEQGIN
ncbi:hypothetical protein EMCRGX_G026060 [Ephydatia muelleri]